MIKIFQVLKKYFILKSLLMMLILLSLLHWEPLKLFVFLAGYKGTWPFMHYQCIIHISLLYSARNSNSLKESTYSTLSWLLRGVSSNWFHWTPLILISGSEQPDSTQFTNRHLMIAKSMKRIVMLYSFWKETYKKSI